MFDGLAIDRRTLIVSLAAVLAGRPAFAEDLIIRPSIEGVDPRYAAYASVGSFVPAVPNSIETPLSRILVFYPAGVPEARLVVFSHGALASPSAYRRLLDHWASHGFIVVAPIHDDAVLERGLTHRHSSAAGIAEWKVPTLLQDERAWRSRSDSCSSCIDAIPIIERVTGLKVVADRPIVAGHGYGAYVAQILLGAVVKGHDGEKLKFRDPRFFGAILMSPQGTGVMGLDDQSWVNVSAPILSIVATKENDFTGQDAERKADAFRLSAPGYKHLARLNGAASSAHLGPSAALRGDEARFAEVLRALTTAFLKAYANYDRDAFKDMSSGFFERMSLGTVSELRR